MICIWNFPNYNISFKKSQALFGNFQNIFSTEKGTGYFSDAVKIVSPTDGRSAFVIQVDNQVISPRLADDLSAVQSVDMIHAVHDLVGTDTVGVVHELQERLPAVAAHLPELANRHSPRPPAEQNALRVLDALT